MNRRKFLLSGAAGLAMASACAGRSEVARAAISADRAGTLKTTLTPFGAERAGNAAGTIPAWTGGATTIPAGFTPDMMFMPDLFPGEKSYLTINSANMAQYKDQLSEATMLLMTKYGFSIDVYPTHRTAAAPQYVYDNIAKNAVNAKPNERGARYGFTGAYGGAPFPIPEEGPDQGAQIIWNHLSRWYSAAYTYKFATFNVNQGVPALGAVIELFDEFPYYDPKGSLESFNGVNDRSISFLKGPPPLYGQELLQVNYIDPAKRPEQTWQLLPGQGRVRKAPELAFDTPSPGSSGLLNFDEVHGFFGSPERYDWKSLGKREFFIPYNNNNLLNGTSAEILGRHFPNPAFARWERHRVWVLEATLAAGERNVVARRRFYIDEDTWTISVADEYDAQGNLWKTSFNYLVPRPDLPGVVSNGGTLFNLQTDQYNHGGAPWKDPKLGAPFVFKPISPQMFNPQAMAARAQY